MYAKGTNKCASKSHHRRPIQFTRQPSSLSPFLKLRKCARAADEIDVGMERKILLFAPLNHFKCNGSHATPVRNVRWQPNRIFFLLLAAIPNTSLPLERNDFKCCATIEIRLNLWIHFCCCRFDERIKSLLWISAKKNEKNTERDLSSAPMLYVQPIFLYFSLFCLEQGEEKNRSCIPIFCIYFLLIWGQAITSINEIKMKRFHREIIEKKECDSYWSIGVPNISNEFIYSRKSNSLKLKSMKATVVAIEFFFKLWMWCYFLSHFAQFQEQKKRNQIRKRERVERL